MRINAATVKAVHAAAASKDKRRPVLTMAHVDPTRGTVTVTDSYRLFTARCMESTEVGDAINVPAAMVKTLPHVKTAPYATEITADDATHITATNVLAEVTQTQYVDMGGASFPNYSQLLTEAATADRLTSAITVSTALLADILKGFSKLGDDTVTIAFGDPHKPLLITPASNASSAALVMPVRRSNSADDIAHVIATVDALTKAGE